MITQLLLSLMIVLVALLALALHRATVARETTHVRYDMTRELLHRAELRVDTLHADLNLARERLVQAWKDGYTVPTAIAEDEEHTSAAPLFSTSQEEWLDQWEDMETQQRWRQFLLRRHRAGRTMDAALADAELELLGGQERMLTPQPTSGLVIG
jgi:hypothetical protein